MKIGILGSGDVGLKLADSLIAIGHVVKVGSRRPEKVAPWAAKYDGKASAGSFADAASLGEIIMLATLWEGTTDARSSCCGNDPQFLVGFRRQAYLMDCQKLENTYWKTRARAVTKNEG